jgi:hypothetical protein
MRNSDIHDISGRVRSDRDRPSLFVPAFRTVASEATGQTVLLEAGDDQIEVSRVQSPSSLGQSDFHFLITFAFL